MNKFIKRLRKLGQKNLDTLIMVGYSEDFFDDIISNCGTLFLIDNRITNVPTFKNLIHLKDQNFINNLPRVDIVFVNQRYDLNDLYFAQYLLRRSYPLIMLKTEFNQSREYYQFFEKLRYEQISISGDYEIWKVIRR